MTPRKKERKRGRDRGGEKDDIKKERDREG